MYYYIVKGNVHVELAGIQPVTVDFCVWMPATVDYVVNMLTLEYYDKYGSERKVEEVDILWVTYVGYVEEEV